jgi:hypothetical protein
LTGGNNACQIQWNAVANVNSTYTGQYYVYGRTSGGQDVRFGMTATEAGCNAGGTCSFTDVGAAGTAEAVPTSAGNVWSVKNLFETKECGAQAGSSCLIEGNLFEQTWFSFVGQQAGAIVLHSLQEPDQMASVVTRNLTFRYNKIRMSSTAMSIASAEPNNNPGGLNENITIQHNLFYDMGSDQGDYNTTILFSGGTFRPSMCGRNHQAAAGLTLDHNTFISTSANKGYITVNSVAAEACGVNWPHEDLKIKNNIFMRGEDPGDWEFTYLNHDGAYQNGRNADATWAVIATGDNKEWARNVVFGASNPVTNYEDCAGCFFPADQNDFESQFVDYDGKNFRLAADSDWKDQGTDGVDVGANIDAIEAFTSIALSGNNTGNVSTTIIRIRIKGE